MDPPIEIHHTFRAQCFRLEENGDVTSHTQVGKSIMNPCSVTSIMMSVKLAMMMMMMMMLMMMTMMMMMMMMMIMVMMKLMLLITIMALMILVIK